MKMPILLLAVASCWLCSIQEAAAQEFRLNGYVNYTFDDRFDSRYSNTSYFNGKIEGNVMWGVGVEYMLAPSYGIELQYQRMDTNVPVNYWRNGDVFRDIELGINYISVGLTRYLAINDIVEPFGGAMIGLMIADNKSPAAGEPTSSTKFAWGLRLGSNFWLTDYIGLKVQAQLFSAVEAVGGGFYIGTGGVSGGISPYSTIYQFGLGGGLAFRFGGF